MTKAAGLKPYYLYLLLCEDGSYYTGIAVDPIQRFLVHASGKGAAYTRSHVPERILACREYPDCSSALKAEYEVKQLPKARKLEFFTPDELVWPEVDSDDSQEVCALADR